MDWRAPHRVVADGVRGDVLAVLALAVEALSGREIARRADASQQRTRDVLVDLAGQGLVRVREAPPALHYQLNRDHLAAGPLLQLVDMRQRLLQQIASAVVNWMPPPLNVTAFGSFARGEAISSSDLDFLVVIPEGAQDGFSYWDDQLPALGESIQLMTGNACEFIEYRLTRLREAAQRRDALFESIRVEGIPIVGVPLADLTRDERRRDRAVADE